MADTRTNLGTVVNQKKSDDDTYPTLFIPKGNIPSFGTPVYGLEIFQAVEAVTGKRDRSECVQKIAGMWRIVLKDGTSRSTILTRGLNIRGHSVTVLGKNPYLSSDGEETIRLRINNMPYSISNETIKGKLRSIGVEVCGEMEWELYKDNKKLTSCKTGTRYINMAPPKEPLPKSIQIADKFTAYLSYRGQDEQITRISSPTKGRAMASTPIIDKEITPSSVRQGLFGAADHSPLRQRPMSPFQFGNEDHRGKPLLNFILKDAWKSHKNRLENQEENGIPCNNLYEQLDLVSDDDDSITTLKRPFQAGCTSTNNLDDELEPGEIPHDGCESGNPPRDEPQQPPQDGSLFQQDWWDFKDAVGKDASGSEPGEGYVITQPRDEPNTHDAPRPSSAQLLTVPNISEQSIDSLPGNKTTQNHTPPPKPQRKGKAWKLGKNQLTLDEMATRGRNRTRLPRSVTQKKLTLKGEIEVNLLIVL